MTSLPARDPVSDRPFAPKIDPIFVMMFTLPAILWVIAPH
jgi:hypothetical protein